MALETLKDVKKIGGFNVERAEGDKPGENHIEINDKLNAITFKIQSAPIKEVGVNGCQVDTIIEAAKIIIEGLNAKYPCRENGLAITKLDEALMWLRERTRRRTEMGIEGTSA